MKATLGKKIMTMIFVPFLIVFGIVSVYIAYMLTNYFTNWTELEIKAISDINAATLEGCMNAVRVSVISAAELLETMSTDGIDARGRAEKLLGSMFNNDAVFSVWLAFEPNAFDGHDTAFKYRYPGSPSGRFMLSFVRYEDRIIVAPDMDETILDDPSRCPWYTLTRDNDEVSVGVQDDYGLYDYKIAGIEPVYAFTIAAPVHRGGKVIGVVGADVRVESMTIGIGREDSAAVALFYPNGQLFYAEDASYAGKSLDVLELTQLNEIKNAINNNESLFLRNEYSYFLDDQSFTYFHPVFGGGTDAASLYLYVAVPHPVALGRLTLMLVLVALVTLTVLVLLFILLLFIVGRVSRPVRELALAADSISQGNLETEIAFFPDFQGEIGMMSRSLHRMVEQFRINLINKEQLQEETTLRSLVYVVTTDKNTADSFRELARALREHFGVYRMTIVLTESGKATVMARSVENGTCAEERFPQDYKYHTQVVSHFSPERKLVFFNSFALASHKMAFLGADTASVCLLPMWDETRLLGYLIFENNNRKKMLRSCTEIMMIHVANLVSNWIAERRRTEAAAGSVKPNAKPVREAEEPRKIGMSGENRVPKTDEPSRESFIASVRGIEGLEPDAAVEAMGGMEEVYEKSVRLFARTAPDSMARIDAYIDEGDVKNFAIEIHGIKGALNSLGAMQYGETAQIIENLAKDGELAAAAGEYRTFRTALKHLQLRLSAITKNAGKSGEGDLLELVKSLETARQAAEEYDSLAAYDAISPHAALTYGEETDALVRDITITLEEFDCETALFRIALLTDALCAENPPAADIRTTAV